MWTLLDALGAHASRWDFSTPHPKPHMFYSTDVTNELVRTLSQSQRTSQRLPGHKPSSNSVLPVAWITDPRRKLILIIFQKKSQEGQDYDHDQEGGGIDLVKAKKVLKAEDKFDKELKKEQKKAKKRELKEAKNANDKRNAGAKLVRLLFIFLNF